MVNDVVNARLRHPMEYERMAVKTWESPGILALDGYRAPQLRHSCNRIPDNRAGGASALEISRTFQLFGGLNRDTGMGRANNAEKGQ